MHSALYIEIINQRLFNTYVYSNNGIKNFDENHCTLFGDSS